MMTIVCISVLLPSVNFIPDPAIKGVTNEVIPEMAKNTHLTLLLLITITLISGVVMIALHNRIVYTRKVWVMCYSLTILISMFMCLSIIKFYIHSPSVKAGYIRPNVQYNFFIEDISLFSIPIIYVLYLTYTLWSKRGSLLQAR
ncbi:MAG: hypothetical protein JNJ85_12815 [Candidatus Kapabacteria bacterium]|nr:hypothetical protein [Candidatus Kapabacteria bacterium]